MDDARARFAEEVFHEAVTVQADQRRALLEARCGKDAELRREVESLLAREASLPPDFLVTPPFTIAATPGQQEDGTAPSRLSDPEMPERIGHYRLVNKLGEGGCGSVYSAEQETPVRRPVALKVIKLGMDTREVIARFEAERQALALMDHGGIARVFDAGATETGRPYFVMELVSGVPITRYCDDQRLAVRERLKLFADVCHAVQHAHQKGIIHRDIKPSNILVAPEDGRPTPKVIDFGIAKATNRPLTDRTLATEAGQLLGTPEYMSPEQAEMAGNVDTRSDVYSLGAVLFELLTGTTPFEPDGLRQTSFARMQEILRERDPPRPSTRIRTLGAGGRQDEAPRVPIEEVASRRAATPGGLAKMLRGDLDVIVTKCLAKDRQRRYSTAEELGRDLDRYLRSEPIGARRDSAPYLLRKFIGRHKLGVTAALTLAVVITAGLFVSLAFWREAVRQRDSARLAGEQERSAREQAQSAEAAAQRRFDQVRQMVRSLLFDLHDQVAPLQGSTKVREYLVRKGLDYLDELARDAHKEPVLLREVALGYDKLGDVQGSQHFYGAHLGDPAGALKSYQKALAIRESLVARAPDDGPSHQDVAASLQRVGDMLVDVGKLDDALATYQRALQEAAWPPDDGTIRRFRGVAFERIGNIHWSRQELDAALSNYRRALALREQLQKEGFSPADTLRSLTVAHEKVGNVLRAQKRVDEALAEFRVSLQLREECAKNEPDNAFLQRDLLVGYGKVGDILLGKGDFSEAGRLHEKALAIAERLAASDPKNLQARRDQAVCYEKVGDVLLAKKEVHKALASFRRRLEISEAVLAAEPLSVESRMGVAVSYFKIASAEEAQAAAASSRGDTSAHWRAAKDGYQRAKALVNEMDSKKQISPQTAKSCYDEIQDALARCDQGLADAGNNPQAASQPIGSSIQ
jgi:eukaryotic-like serine/threonine-protein kinase